VPEEAELPVGGGGQEALTANRQAFRLCLALLVEDGHAELAAEGRVGLLAGHLGQEQEGRLLHEVVMRQPIVPGELQRLQGLGTIWWG